MVAVQSLIDHMIGLHKHGQETRGFNPKSLLLNPKHRGFVQMFWILVEGRMTPVGQLEYFLPVAF